MYPVRLLGLLLVALLASVGAHAEDDNWRDMLRELDAAYYYPAKAGVKTMRGKVKTSLHEELSRQYKFVSDEALDITFYWKAPNRSRFIVELAGVPQSATSESFTAAVEAMMIGRDVFLAPTPLSDVLVHYKGFVMPEGNDRKIYGIANTPDTELRSFTLVYDPISLRIKQMIQEFPGSTIAIRPTYESRGLMYVQIVQRRVFRDLMTHTEIVWDRAPGHDSAWVVTKMRATTVSRTTPEMPPSVIEMEFTDWEINGELPSHVFPDAGR